MTENISHSDDSERELSEEDKKLFLNQYRKIDSEYKWKLKSGRTVEDLYKLGMKCNFHNLVHSFIIDIEDKFIRSNFTSVELDEIKNENYRPPPELDTDLLKFVNSFAKSSTTEIRKELNRAHPRLGEDYDPKRGFPYQHVKMTVNDWVMVLESEPNPLVMNLPEAWCRINVWRCIDVVFSDTPYVFVIGGECAGIASTERKNRSRTMGSIKAMSRKSVGKKGDAFVRSVGSRPVDWAASEASSSWNGDKDTKTFRESGLSFAECNWLSRYLKKYLERNGVAYFK